ncbi:hypothetical protein OGZ01_24300 [Vibrio harveyi]|nr:hypothetical protein [Vibrio harveyi]
MKYSKIATLVAAGLVLAGCNSTPSQQTYAVESNAGNSSLIIGKSAFEFTNSDIEVPAYFNTQGLQFCTYEANEKDSRCPLAKKTILAYTSVTFKLTLARTFKANLPMYSMQCIQVLVSSKRKRLRTR